MQSVNLYVENNNRICLADMQRHGTIYTEIHNHGRRSGGNQDGNRCSLRRVRGAGVQRVYGYRFVGEISVHGKRYRCRSYDYNKVVAWLEDMREKYSDIPRFSEEGYEKLQKKAYNQTRSKD